MFFPVTFLSSLYFNQLDAKAKDVYRHIQDARPRLINTLRLSYQDGTLVGFMTRCEKSLYAHRPWLPSGGFGKMSACLLRNRCAEYCRSDV